MADKKHRDKPSEDGINSLFAKCSLTLSKEISSQKDDELLTAITSELKFKITSYADLTIEKKDVTEEDMSRLTKLLRSKLDPRLGDDYEIINSENDEVNHQRPESDGAEKSHQAVKKEGSESLESFEEISGPSDVTDESQSPEKIGNALKDSVAPQPANSQDEIDDLNNMFTRSLSLSESQTGDSSSRSPSQIMTGMDHQILPVNLEPTSSEEKREYVSAPCQYMPSSQPVVSQLTGAAGITSKKSDSTKGMMPRPPVDGKRDKQSKSGNQQQAEDLSSTDTQGVRGIKDKDHEENIGQMSSQEKEMPEGKIPQPSGHRDSNGGSVAENEGKVEDGQKNKNSTTVLNEETAKDGKMQANTTSSKKTKKSERKPLEEVHEKAKDESDVSDVDSLGSDTGDKGKCATSYNGNKVKQSDGGKRRNTDQVSAGQELEEEGIGQVQGQSSITNQCDRMEHNRESDLSQKTHKPESSQDMTDDVGMTPNNTLGTRTKTRQRHTEVAPNQGNGFQGRPDGRNAEEDYAYNSHNADQQMKKSVDLNKVEIFTSESDNDESYEDKGEIQYDTQDKPSESSKRPGEPRRVPSQRGHKQVKHHSDDEHMMDTGGEQPLEPTVLDNQTNVNKSMPDEESYEEQDRKSEDMNQIRESEGQSGSVSDKDDEHKKDNSLFSQSTTERQRSIKECGQPEKQRGNAKGKHQTGSAGKQSEDSTDGGDINTESAQSRQDNEATIDQKQLEKQWRNTRNVDSAERKGTIDNNTDGSDITERDETESKCNRQAEITVSNEQSCDGSEKQLSQTGNVHPGGKTKGQRGYDAGENDKHSVPVSTREDSGCDSQSRKNKVYREEKEGSQPVRHRQQGGDGTDKDNEYKKKLSSQSHSRADDETRIREHMARKEQRKMTGSMQNDGRSERHDGQESDKDKYMYNSGMPHSVSGHRGIDQKEGDVYPNDDDDNEASGSDSQFGARDDISKSSSSENSTRQDDENPSTTSDEDTDISNSKNRHAELRSRVEKASQEDRTVHSCHAVTGEIQKGQAMNLAKSRYPETPAQKTYMESLEGRDSSDKMEKQIDSDGEKQMDDVDSPPEVNKAKGQRMQKKDKDKVERDSKRKETYDKVNSEKHKGKDELNDERIKSKAMETSQKDLSNADQLDTESDDEDPSIEYVMKKVNFKLARMYYEKRPEYRYFENAKKIDEGYLMIFRNKDNNGLRFLKSLKRLKFETIVYAVNDRPKVRPIADQLKSKDPDVELIDHGSKSFLVGPKEKVAEVKQKIISKIQETDENGKDTDIHQKPQRQRSQPDMRDDTDSSSRFSDGGARPKNSEGVKGSKEKDPYESTKDGSDFTRRSLYQGDSMERYSRDADPGVYTGRYSDIKVHIHDTDITKLRVDCIVNAANTRLKHGGGVARVIATAAGKELQEACERFIDAGNTVPVTYLFVSPGGRLPAKHVLHAVGPKWDLYTDKEKCTDDLRRTVLRCLVEAMKLRLSSIALPSISAAIFRVPKEHCARSYMNAVKHFEEIRKDMDHRDCTLKEIHFVDVDDIMVNYIRECFMKHWREPSDPDARQADEKVFQEQLKSTKSQPPGNQISGHSSRSDKPSTPGGSKPTRPSYVSSSNVTGATAKSVEKDTVYQLGELQLCISSRPALSIRSDLVITVGEEFDKLSGIPDYSIKTNKKPCEDVPKKKNCYTFSFVHKPDGKYRQLLCRLFPDPKSQSELNSAFENLDAAIRLAAVRGDKVKDVKYFVLTSSVLYADPSNKKHKPPNVSDRKLVGNFGKLVFDYVEKLSKEFNCKVKQVVVTASEDVSIQLCKILETRPDIKNVGASAPGAYPHPRPRGQSPARWGAGSRGGSTSSFNSGGARANHGQPSSAYGNSRPRGQSPARPGSAYQGGSSSTFSSNSGQTKYDQQHSSDHGSSSGSSTDQRLVCTICTFPKQTMTPTSCCKNLLCSDCCDKVTFCPYCTKQWKIRTGNQPKGYMIVSYTAESADGYEGKGSWKIEYSFPSGSQTDDHPNPGKSYSGTTRTAYIPATEDSMDILKLLRLAFMRRLTFTVGVSRTTGQDNKITWNDIHHKTKLHGGNYGYPDPAYFGRVIEELRAKGVTLESMIETEAPYIRIFEKSLTSFYRYFSDYSTSASTYV